MIIDITAVKEEFVGLRFDETTFEIKACIDRGEWVAILAGLTEGETIAVGGVFTLKSEVLKGGLEEHHH